MELILASRSPRRRRILTDLGAAFRVEIPQVEEIVAEGDLYASVAHNAVLKCDGCRAQFAEAAIIAADTGIAFEGHVVMKPKDPAEAATLLNRFSGKTHQVMTGVALALPEQAPTLHVEVSRVTFKTLTADVIETYLNTVNPLDRAGAYDISDHGEMVVDRWEGSFTNIVGLPIEVVKPWLQAHGLAGDGRPDERA